mmetsp:Transcript_46392/g.91534  ORF Transcript_46392/g.91534 Transcript_46392/m.91534 type:complete len:141 (-) Transcript_46392:1010-1432(-)
MLHCSLTFPFSLPCSFLDFRRMKTPFASKLLSAHEYKKERKIRTKKKMKPRSINSKRRQPSQTNKQIKCLFHLLPSLSFFSFLSCLNPFLRRFYHCVHVPLVDVDFHSQAAGGIKENKFPSPRAHTSRQRHMRAQAAPTA